MIIFSGDMIFCFLILMGKVQIFFVDVMGYGLVVVICILLLIFIVRVMVLKGKVLDEIFYEINCKFYFEIFDDCFIVVLGLEICFYIEIVYVINVGLFDILCSM